MLIYLNNGVWTIVLFQRGMVMAEKKIRIKAVYILLWSIIVCAGVFIRTGVMDDLWRHMYDLIYGDSANAVKVGTYSGVNRENNIYCYMDFWQEQVKEMCEDSSAAEKKDSTYGESDDGVISDTESGENGTGTDADDTEQKLSDQKLAEQTASDSAQIIPVSAMNDITSSYIDMDSDTLRSYCYNITYPDCVKNDELDAGSLLDKDISLDMSTGGYKVLIYHTHSSESFVDSRPGEVDDTVIGLGDKLADVLTETYGIPVYHDTTEYDMMTGVLDRNASYDYSREGVAAILESHPEIEVMIDLHRDGVPDDVHLVTDVDGRPTAQIMLINGMCRDEAGNDVDYWCNDNKVDNMAFSLQTYLAGRANYGDIMRKIYISTSRYNMDLMPHAMLAEIGAQTNTVEEEQNAIAPFAAMLAKVLLE